MGNRALAASIAAILLATSPAVADVTGTASVTDGDTLVIHGERIRLYGIDAPESAQQCQDGEGKAWRCGQRAALALSDKIGRRPVTCEQRTTDLYDRPVSVCRAGGEDLNLWMVEQGWARAYRKYSSDYVGAEATARAARVGIWAGTFQDPWAYRKELREEQAAKRAANQNAPVSTGGQSSGCQIKGNISAKGERIYHVPGGQFYDKTRIDGRQGERWFCSEQEAEAAGWRRSSR